MKAYNARSFDLDIIKIQLTHVDRFADLLKELSLMDTCDNIN